ncbi:S-adenosyl-L-methionine-dependent methyltransferase [Artomyces pyxidatus]|uniref:S-adenosyl-L-methionine-dependent methyltransferase n=1 Tax=Artomyces pyxidatus TaxID=48021 RepID=A0ACB8TDR7_9AGAM|nr:S-adenosyl-L-methionine-dependent methyltransferase [Artomyces pyxidatus]
MDNEHRKADLRALVALIGGAVEDAIRAYDTQGRPVPSLDDVDDADSEKLGSLALDHAMRTSSGACAQLCANARPARRAQCASASPRILQTARAAGDVVPARGRGKGHGVHISEISEKGGVEQGKLARVLRCLTMGHVFREVAPDIFANNRTSYALRSASPLSSAVCLWSSDFTQFAHARLYDALEDPEYGLSYDVMHAPFAFGVKQAGLGGRINPFIWHERHPEKVARFSEAMTSNFFGDVCDHYTMAILPPGMTWCDVGAGLGSRARGTAVPTPPPDLAGSAERRRARHSGARSTDLYWKERCSAAVQRGQIAFVPIDFLKESPVPEQDIYYMRHIIHDWPDADCVKILRNIHSVMHPDSRILIHEYILPNPAQKGGVGADAPAPLLPNYGAGAKRAYLQDINMLDLLNAKERTVGELAALGEKAGLETAKVWEGVEHGIVEMRIANRVPHLES